MARQRREEEKRRRQQKRLEKRLARGLGPEGLGQIIYLPGAVEALKQLSNVPPPPALWPGGCDPSLSRPDMIKFDLGRFATEIRPGSEKLQHLARNMLDGPLEFRRDLEHWAIEEFLWHGLPGDSWQPIDAFLDKVGRRFPPPAAQQLRLWKEARLGIFAIGAVVDDTVLLREYDEVRQTVSATPVGAITLNFGGVNRHRNQQGMMLLTYLAPWVPAEGLFCGIGYGGSVPRSLVNETLPYLGLRHPDIACRPFPWNKDKATAEEYRNLWRNRDWQGWLEKQVKDPFLAMAPDGPDGPPIVRRVQRLLPSPAEQARQFGIYFVVEYPGEECLVGATAVVPVDLTSPNCLPLAEYRAYRKQAGPPPGTVGIQLTP